MRIAVLVKQVPAFEEMVLGDDGRLVRDGIELELNPYCRRAVAQAVLLAAAQTRAQVTVITLGPPAAEDSLREAIAWGLDRDVNIDGLLVSDPAFAGSDTIATAKALAAAIAHSGPFDLVLTGRNSVDADTGQVPAQVAELCGLPFLTGVRYLNIDSDTVHARCEHDDGWMQAEVELPAILSCAERLCDPAKVDPPQRALVPAERIRRVTAADLGPGPWGQDASMTTVGETRVMEVTRARHLWADEPVAIQVEHALAVLREHGALDETVAPAETVAESRFHVPETMVLCEPGRDPTTRELLAAAARLTGNVLAVTVEPPDAPALVTWGANEVVFLEGDNVEEDVAHAVVDLIATHLPVNILAGSTAWGREVASRVAAAIDCGLVGDAVELEMDADCRALTAWKPAFGGQLVAAIGYRFPSRQLATVRPGMLPKPNPRPGPTGEFLYQTIAMDRRSRVRVLARTRDDDLDVLGDARVVLGIGQGVAPEQYDELEALRALLGAELAATRKVTDKGWLPRSRQVGITGRSVAPRLYVSIGASGKFNHVVGVRAARTVLAINPDASAPIFQHADAGIVAPWEEAVPLLVDALRAQLVVD
jgi:electron transfer flavoprotein alpha subunit